MLLRLGEAHTNRSCTDIWSKRLYVSRNYVRFERFIVREIDNKPHSRDCKGFPDFPGCLFSRGNLCRVQLPYSPADCYKRHIVVSHHSLHSEYYMNVLRFVSSAY